MTNEQRLEIITTRINASLSHYKTLVSLQEGIKENLAKEQRILERLIQEKEKIREDIRYAENKAQHDFNEDCKDDKIATMGYVEGMSEAVRHD